MHLPLPAFYLYQLLEQALGGDCSRRQGAAASPGARDLSDAEESLPSAGRAGFRSESGS